jgi:hypothetical protein
MGFNTTVVVMNDALSEISQDKEFGLKLQAAVAHAYCYGCPVPISSGGMATAALVVESHHADEMKLVMVGGNKGVVVEGIEEPTVQETP